MFPVCDLPMVQTNGDRGFRRAALIISWSVFRLMETAQRSAPIDVGILGATGMVGQQFIRLLAGHPWFRPVWLAASERSEGRRYSEATTWRLPDLLPDTVATRTVDACTPGRGPQLIFSALDAAAADTIEPAFAAAGHVVVSNARSFRMQDDVPLLIPEINPDHLALIRVQRR